MSNCHKFAANVTHFKGLLRRHCFPYSLCCDSHPQPAPFLKEAKPPKDSPQAANKGNKHDQNADYFCKFGRNGFVPHRTHCSHRIGANDMNKKGN